MRNIVLSNFEHYCLSSLKSWDAFFCYPGYLLFYEAGRVIKYEEGKLQEVCNLMNILFPQSDAHSIAKALDIKFIPEKNIIYVILCNGDIVSIENNESTWVPEIVGSIEGGLKASKWSPENEVVVLITGNDTVILMTNDFDPLSETGLHGGGFGEKQFTTVGWGKKETQFRGSEGKYNHEVDQQLQDKNPLLSDDKIRISWRGDAEYFAVTCINPENMERYIRIFNKDGILQYTSENVIGLEHLLNWRPSGNLMASTQRLPNKHVVCFFEKNGLKHGEFTLPFKQNEVIVKELIWNLDSKLLALMVEKVVVGASLNRTECHNSENIHSNVGEKMILIYCVNNYHWYSKYSIPFSGDIHICIQWDEHINNMLHVILKKENKVYHFKYTWLWTVHKSKGKSAQDEGLVAVIDGAKLCITSFKCGILPPPMCTYFLEMPCQINQVGFGPIYGDSSFSSNDLFVQLSNNHVLIYKFESNEKKTHEILHKFVGEFDFSNRCIYNIQWISPKKFAFCEIFIDSPPKSFLNIIDIINYNKSIEFMEKKYSLTYEVSILACHSDSCILLHNSAGRTYLFDQHNETFTELYPGQKRLLFDVEVIQERENKYIIFSLDVTNKFYINDKMVANNITSFHIHGDYLLLTNLKHRLLCVPIEIDAEKFFYETDMNSISTRRIERGSRIITSISEGAKVILQMPRGNLECIQPRALSFSVIGKYLDELHYFSAFSIMRQQRINLNLFYDHNPDLFKENVNNFIQQVKDPSWISLFLSEVVEEDVTETMYSVIYKNKKNKRSLVAGKSKILAICELFEKELEQMKNAESYVLPILTSYLKRGDNRYIECALGKIKKLKEAENNGDKLPVTFDEAFRYMLYLIDVEELYRVALGMYDFDLVLLVAAKSQKDPKEYLQFLNDLRKLELNYQKFTIDKYLKRYEKALQHLLKCEGNDAFTECLTFIKSHKLYRTALNLTPRNTDRYKQICSTYADELFKSNLYEEAGIMFSKAGLYGNAIKAFTKSGNWQEVILCSTKMSLAQEEINDLYNNLAAELRDAKKFREAAIVYQDYVKNIELTVLSLTTGKLFADAFRVAELHHKNHLLQEFVIPAILDYYQGCKIQISSFRDVFNSQKKRLSIVREVKLQKIKGMEENCDYSSEQDSYSESSTVFTQSYAGSRTTNRTFRSAKNKRKQERKLLNLKEGSQYEDLALIASLHNIATVSMEMCADIKELNASLIKINEEGLAQELQNDFDRLLKEIEESKAEIWNPELLFSRHSYGPDATSNTIATSFIHSENITHTNLISPRLLIPPEVQSNVRWKLDILNP